MFDLDDSIINSNKMSYTFNLDKEEDLLNKLLVVFDDNFNKDFKSNEGLLV